MPENRAPATYAQREGADCQGRARKRQELMPPAWGDRQHAQECAETRAGNSTPWTGDENPDKWPRVGLGIQGQWSEKSWDAGRTSAGRWVDVNESKEYYADDAGSACAAYLARPRQLYWPAVDPDLDPTRPAAIWPPTDTLGFLQLQRLEPVPVQYERLLH
jgi:hypothetical protein